MRARRTDRGLELGVNLAALALEPGGRIGGGARGRGGTVLLRATRSRLCSRHSRAAVELNRAVQRGRAARAARPSARRTSRAMASPARARGITGTSTSKSCVPGAAGRACACTGVSSLARSPPRGPAASSARTQRGRREREKREPRDRTATGIRARSSTEQLRWTDILFLREVANRRFIRLHCDVLSADVRGPDDGHYRKGALKSAILEMFASSTARKQKSQTKP